MKDETGVARIVAPRGDTTANQINTLLLLVPSGGLLVVTGSWKAATTWKWRAMSDLEIKEDADSSKNAESLEEDLWKDDPKAMSPQGGGLLTAP